VACCRGRSARLRPSAGSALAAGSNPQQQVLHPFLKDGERSSSCQKPPSLEADRRCDARASGVDGSLATVPVTVQAVASVPHRSRPSVTPWKTQCASSVQPRLDAHPWNVKASTVRGTESCAGLGTRSGQCGAWSRPLPGGPVGAGVKPSHGRVNLGQSLLSVYQADPMGPFRVKGTATPEVKFLDRCKTHCSEGVLQGCVRRSRMRVWGAKMIRHRRSPAL